MCDEIIVKDTTIPYIYTLPSEMTHDYWLLHHPLLFWS